MKKPLKNDLQKLSLIVKIIAIIIIIIGIQSFT